MVSILYALYTRPARWRPSGRALTSASGPKGTSVFALRMSAFGGKADVMNSRRHTYINGILWRERNSRGRRRNEAHELKHDGYRLQIQTAVSNGNSGFRVDIGEQYQSHRGYPSIVEAAMESMPMARAVLMSRHPQGLLRRARARRPRGGNDR
jgi:hypothetical protein